MRQTTWCSGCDASRSRRCSDRRPSRLAARSSGIAHGLQCSAFNARPGRRPSDGADEVDRVASCEAGNRESKDGAAMAQAGGHNQSLECLSYIFHAVVKTNLAETITSPVQRPWRSGLNPSLGGSPRCRRSADNRICLAQSPHLHLSVTSHGQRCFTKPKLRPIQLLPLLWRGVRSRKGGDPPPSAICMAIILQLPACQTLASPDGRCRIPAETCTKSTPACTWIAIYMATVGVPSASLEAASPPAAPPLPDAGHHRQVVGNW